MKLLVNLSEPESVDNVKIKMCEPVLGEKTVTWMRRMNFLREKIKTDKCPHLNATFKFVRRHYRKLREIDQKSFFGKCGKGGFVTADEFFKIHSKINKNTRNL